MGVLAPGSAHARPSARPPIDTSGNFPAHVSAESPSNISPNPSEVISEVSEPWDNFWNFQKKILKNLKTPPQGARGGLRIFLGVNIFFCCCENEPPLKFQNCFFVLVGDIRTIIDKSGAGGGQYAGFEIKSIISICEAMSQFHKLT